MLAASSPLGTAAAADFVDLATPFEQIAQRTLAEPEDARVAAIRDGLNGLLPGIYPAGDAVDRRIARALVEFPAAQESFSRAVRAFPQQLDESLVRFRTVFPDFVSPLPIYLYHSLGTRDGGSEYLEPGHRHVMLFGADMIAALHADDSLAPFFEHELFHLQHGRRFADCDQFWCGLWQEGLAVAATAAMTPGATDHQLLLDLPRPIRDATDGHWRDALCFVAIHFDDADGRATRQALVGGGGAPAGLPDRFGYYVGYRLAQDMRTNVRVLAALSHARARRLLRKALVDELSRANAGCAPPAVHRPVTMNSAHAV